VCPSLGYLKRLLDSAPTGGLATIETVTAAELLKDESLPPAVRALVRECVHEDGTLVLSDLSVRLLLAPFASGHMLKRSLASEYATGEGREEILAAVRAAAAEFGDEEGEEEGEEDGGSVVGRAMASSLSRGARRTRTTPTTRCRRAAGPAPRAQRRLHLLPPCLWSIWRSRWRAAPSTPTSTAWRS